MEAGTLVRKCFVKQGMVTVSREECIITTVLGSCISVCLWDAIAGIGGMNHYMLPLWNGEGLPSPRYGNIAIPRLIEKITASGGTKSNLKAKVFGGAEMISVMKESRMKIGAQNIILAEDLLAREGVPIISIDVGGHCGRRIHFNTRTGAVMLKRLSSENARQR
jgi:chemotaxis protein CheD